MKDAVITVRLPRATRMRVEDLARREGRSLSQQVEQLIERGMAVDSAKPPTAPRPLAGALRGGVVPTLADFATVRSTLSKAVKGSSSSNDYRRR
jgi:predicted transcriptional regulator